MGADRLRLAARAVVALPLWAFGVPPAIRMVRGAKGGGGAKPVARGASPDEGN